MSDWTPPSAAELDQLAALATRPENRAYFFDRLENPEWVPALEGRGVFDSPPAPVPADEPGYVRFPPWPEGRYLARMAPLAPDAVAAVLQKSQPSANPWVTGILLKCVQALPGEQFRRLAPKTVQWITDPTAAEFVDHIADEAATTASRLVREGNINQGLNAAKYLLMLERRSSESGDSTTAEILALLPEPVGRLSEWRYKEVIAKILPDLVDSAGLKGLKLLSSRLSVAVKFSRREGESSESDAGSCIWRPAIEDHTQNVDHGVRCALVTAVRDAAVRLAEVSQHDLHAVVQVLEAETVLHRRIALHVVGVVADAADLAAERIADRDLFDDYRLKHEYAGLLRSRLGETPAETQRTFLSWVLAGPDLNEFRQRQETLSGSAPSPEDETVYAECWQLDWLSIAADHLSGDALVLHGELVAKYGEPEHPDLLAWSESGFGPETPLTAEEMNNLSPGEIIEFLASWQPGDGARWGFRPSIEGLGRTLQATVAERAGDFAAAADRVKALDPTYVRSFLNGLETAVKAGAFVPWDPPLRLIASVLGHPFDHHGEPSILDRDPGWSWTRGQAASLLKEGVADRDNRIPFELREVVWSVLEPLTGDPDPLSGDEASRSYPNMDPFTQSLNVNRGKAMHAVVAYALWCRRELEARGEETAAGFDLISEVRTVLERHLEPRREPSLAVRAVYGNWLPWLILLDESWVAANITRILPRAPELADLRDAAWDTYISWCPPFDAVYSVLQHEYEAAVERVPTTGTVGFADDERTDAMLGEHLITLFWRGRLQPSLLERWFELADDHLAERVMSFLGRTLGNADGDVEPEVLQRIRQLWDSRLAVIGTEPQAHEREANAFAHTFASAKLDDEWSLAGLHVALKAGGLGWLGSDVIARLSEVAAARPAEATELTLQILQSAANAWDHFALRDQVRDLMAATNHATEPQTLKNRKAIVDHYVKRGDNDFREFTPAQS